MKTIFLSIALFLACLGMQAQTETIILEKNWRFAKGQYVGAEEIIFDYTVKIGASGEDIRQIKTFNVSKEMIVEKVQKALEPQIAINELKK